MVLSLIFLCVVAALPGDFFKHGEIYRQLPLYCFLEKKALQKENGRDRETEMLLQEKNAEHLGEEVEAENRKEQETLLMAEAEEVEKKEALQKNEELQKKKEIQKKEAEDAEMAGKKSSAGKKNEKETVKGNTEQEVAEPEITEPGGSEQEATEPGDTEPETPPSEENRSGENTAKEQETVALPHPQIDLSQAKLADFDYVMNQFFILDSNTETNAQQISAPRFLKEDLSVKKDSSVPQILIYHTHSQEAFKDSKAGDKKTSIVGMGDILTKELNDTYRIPTMHHEGVYDLIGGKMDRSRAYQLAEVKVRKILKKYPSIEVVIDLHRDGVGNNTHLVTSIDGKKTGQIMFFNGLSRTKKNGDIAYLKNPYIQDNLAFSMQMQLAAAKKYPGFTRRIYLKSYRYNMHLMPKYLLIEAGAQTNTVKEMQRSMKVLADLLDVVVDP